MARPDSAAAAPIAFRHPVRVYWEDTDAGGVVFYANYLKFFQRARTEWLRALGLGQQALREATGAIFVVGSTALHYRKPARLDDLLEVTVQPLEIGRASLVVAQQAFRAAELLCEGQIRVGCVDAGTFRPQRFPTAVAERLKALPAGSTGAAPIRSTDRA